MLAISRPAINPYFGAVSTLLDLLLAAVVAAYAQGLQGTEPEAVWVTTMRLDVVGNRRCCHEALLQAHAAQRMRLQLPLGALLPAA